MSKNMFSCLLWRNNLWSNENLWLIISRCSGPVWTPNTKWRRRTTRTQGLSFSTSARWQHHLSTVITWWCVLCVLACVCEWMCVWVTRVSKGHPCVRGWSVYQRVIHVSEGEPCVRRWSVYQRVICVSEGVDWIILISVHLCVVSQHICSTNIWRQKFSYDVCVMWRETGQCCVMWPARWKQKRVRTVKHKRSESYTAVLQYPVASGHICSTL